MPHDFNRDILGEVAHRPWPMPERPWIMTQTWNDLLFAHWPVDPSVLRSRVPADFPLDLFEAQAWLGIVPFHMTNVAPRGMPALPWVSAFPELNVRTYVRIGDKPGVFFFSLDAANPLAVAGARLLLNLPYYTAEMVVATAGADCSYRSRRRRGSPEAIFEGIYAPVGPVFEPRPGSLEYFLTERYCLYAVGRRRGPYRLDIHHPPWPLRAATAEIARNSMTDPIGMKLPPVAPLLHFSKRQDMVAWGPQRLTG